MVCLSGWEGMSHVAFMYHKWRQLLILMYFKNLTHGKRVSYLGIFLTTLHTCRILFWYFYILLWLSYKKKNMWPMIVEEREWERWEWFIPFILIPVFVEVGCVPTITNLLEILVWYWRTLKNNYLKWFQRFCET